MSIKKRILAAAEKKASAKLKKQCENAVGTQTDLLLSIIRNNSSTEFGKEMNFDKINSASDFEYNVPLMEYDDLHPWIEKTLHGEQNQLTKEDPVSYAVTSGTTGDKKYIPITPESKKSKSEILKTFAFKMFADHPKLLKGKFFAFISPEVEDFTPAGIPCGSQTGSSYKKMPSILKKHFPVPYAVYNIKDFDCKYYTFMRIAACQDIRLIYACNPSSVILIAKYLAKYTDDLIEDIENGTYLYESKVDKEVNEEIRKYLKPNPKAAKFLKIAAQRGGGVLLPKFIWPNFELIACWKGGTVGTYIKGFDEYYPNTIAVREIGYFASEFFGSMPLSDYGADGVLSIQSNYYEFFPVDADYEPKKDNLLKVDDLKIGKQYYIYITTQAGLYRYNMNDIVEVTGMYYNAPLIKFVQKGKGIVSLTGEKLSEMQMLNAVNKVLANHNDIGQFISAHAIADVDNPLYKVLIEFKEWIDESVVCKIGEEIDAELKIENIEYAAKRESFRLKAPVVRVVKSGEFDAYRRRKNERGDSDGTFKILRLTEDEKFINEFDYEYDTNSVLERALC